VFVKLVIADSDPLIQECFDVSFSFRDDFTITGLIADSSDTVDMCKANNPDVVLLDYRLDCVATTRQIKAHCPNTHIV